MLNRRRNPRLAERISVVMQLRDPDDAGTAHRKDFFCTTRDVSSGGIRLRHVDPVPCDSVVELLVAVTDPPQQFVHVGRVRWARRLPVSKLWLMGVEFTESTGRQMQAWRKYVDSKLSPAPSRSSKRSCKKH